MDTFSYADVNEELNNEEENIRLLNGEFLTYCVEYSETKQHTRSVEEKSLMIEQDYKVALQRVKIIVEETKVARLKENWRKKQIREGKRKDQDDNRVLSSRKKTRPDKGHDMIVEDNSSQDVVSKKGKKKVAEDSPFLELEKIPKQSIYGLPNKSVGDMLMDMKLFKNKYNMV